MIQLLIRSWFQLPTNISNNRKHDFRLTFKMVQLCENIRMCKHEFRCGHNNSGVVVVGSRRHQ